jgi:two-component system sensor histidine kinase UhpB
MSLLTKVILRIALIAIACLACTTVFVMYRAHGAIVTQTETTAERVGHHLQRIYWNRLIWRDGMNKPSIVPFPEWETLATFDGISPGLCVTFAAPSDEPRRLCSRVDKIADPSPGWFAALHHTLFSDPPPVRWSLTSRTQSSGILYASVEPGAAARLAWAKVSVVLGVAGVMAFTIAVLSCLTIGHALLPARRIVTALRRMQDGIYGERLPQLRGEDFSHVAKAVNQLAARLAEAARERAVLTARLFKVQEEERRALARDLHDEFGQCLAATTALAALIETKAATTHPAIANDARLIGSTQQRMMTALRGTLSRLRSQNIEEIGLEESLRELVAEHNAITPGVYRLSSAGVLTGLPRHIAIGIYRTAQECLTNAARHGRPKAVLLHVERPQAPQAAVTVSVTDDGGGDVMRLGNGTGHGLIGLRERLYALGGSLDFAGTGAGIRVLARIPLRADLAGAPA